MSAGAIAVLAGCSASRPDGPPTLTQPPVVSLSGYDLTLTIDSVTQYNPGGCGGLYFYCKFYVPDSGTIRGVLLFGAPTNHTVVDPITNASHAVAGYDSVVFTDSLSGKAVFDTTGKFVVSVGPSGPSLGRGVYDWFSLVGTLDSASFRGTWSSTTDPHGAGKMGRFTGVRR